MPYQMTAAVMCRLRLDTTFKPMPWGQLFKYRGQGHEVFFFIKRPGDQPDEWVPMQGKHKPQRTKAMKDIEEAFKEGEALFDPTPFKVRKSYLPA